MYRSLPLRSNNLVSTIFLYFKLSFLNYRFEVSKWIPRERDGEHRWVSTFNHNLGLKFSFAGFTTQVKRGMIGKHLDGLRSKMPTQSVNQHIPHLKHGHTSKQSYYYNGLGNGRHM